MFVWLLSETVNVKPSSFLRSSFSGYKGRIKRTGWSSIGSIAFTQTRPKWSDKVENISWI